ncbi:hypothetical protein [Herminiimonas sp. CN]|uniref:COG4648 family protein n=1 Tax=Herminiimonas sp. CN TaxID=1349818 RepID=UPI0004740068|nr:hypothetical protein [Herminiimonas sp. CN]
MSAAAGSGRWIALVALGVAYACLAHYTNSRNGTETLGTVLALAPIVLVLLSMAWQARHRIAALLVFCIGCAALYAGWSMLSQHFARIYWLEHAGSQLMLCLGFARTLGSGREPMCSYFARMIEGPLTPQLARYTRQVTGAWAVFFALMALASTLLFLTVAQSTWSVFANFFTAPLIVLMFVLEYGARKCLLPNMQHGHILDAMKVVWKVPSR